MGLTMLSSGAQDCRHDAGAPATVNDRDHKDRFFIWRISDKKIANDLKTQWTRSYVRPSVALLGENYKFANSF